MNGQYTASVYCNEERIAMQAGNNVDELYTWMLIQVTESSGDIHGEIIDNATQKTVRTFRKCGIE